MAAVRSPHRGAVPLSTEKECRARAVVQGDAHTLPGVSLEREDRVTSKPSENLREGAGPEAWSRSRTSPAASVPCPGDASVLRVEVSGQGTEAAGGSCGQVGPRRTALHPHTGTFSE